MAYMTPRAQARREALLAEYSAPRNRSTGMNYNPLSGIADILRGHYGREGQIDLDDAEIANKEIDQKEMGFLVESLKNPAFVPGQSERDKFREDNPLSGGTPGGGPLDTDPVGLLDDRGYPAGGVPYAMNGQPFDQFNDVMDQTGVPGTEGNSVLLPESQQPAYEYQSPTIQALLTGHQIEMAQKDPTEKWKRIPGGNGSAPYLESTISGDRKTDPGYIEPNKPTSFDKQQKFFQENPEDYMKMYESRRDVTTTNNQFDIEGDKGYSPGWKKIDEKFGDTWLSFVAEGGWADSEKLIGQIAGTLMAVEKAIATGQNLSGPMIALVPDKVKAFTNPESISVREGIEEVVQRNLREVLGPQFTEKEGERLIARAYNPSMTEQENAIRVARLLKAMTNSYNAKLAAIKYFTEEGTLQGYRGGMPSAYAIYKAVDAEDLLDSVGNPIKERDSKEKTDDELLEGPL